LLNSGCSQHMHIVDLRRKLLAIVAASVMVLPVFGHSEAKDDPEDQPTGTSAEIINRYLQATQNHEDALRGASMQVDISASIPELKKQGRLHALRKISRVGQVTYRVLGFQGDNSVKSDVIARYLQAEQQGQGDQSFAITPQNYKFKFKGRKELNSDDVYVFQLSPRKKKVGLFKGELWIDGKTGLPVQEKGKLVKNPSIWFKKVEFERDFKIQNGASIPAHMSSTIDVRLIGKVELNIDYSDFVQNADSDDTSQAAVSVALAAAAAK